MDRSSGGALEMERCPLEVPECIFRSYLDGNVSHLILIDLAIVVACKCIDRPTVESIQATDTFCIQLERPLARTNDHRRTQ